MLGVPCPSYEWSASDDKSAWGVCDSDCGGGIQRRTVQCHDTAGDVVFGYQIPFEIVNDTMCVSGKKPSETRACNVESDICSRGGDGGGEDEPAGECRKDDDGLGYCFCRPGYGCNTNTNSNTNSTWLGNCLCRPGYGGPTCCSTLPTIDDVKL